MRARALIVVAMLAAGCIGAAGEGTVPAGDLLATARQAAAERIDDPELVRVEGVEPPRRVETEEQTIVIHEDPVPGDGKAPGWVYTFEDAGRTVTVALRADGEIVAESVDDDPGPTEPLGDWSLGTDEAAEAVFEHPNVSEPGQEVVVRWTLTGGDEPVWKAALSTPGSFDEQSVVVDARDGEVIEVEGCRDADTMDGGMASRGTSGTVTPASETEVEIELSHTGAIDASWDLQGGFGEATAELLHDGTVVETETMSGGGGHTVGLSEAEPGRYVARLTTEEGAHDASIELSATWTVVEC